MSAMKERVKPLLGSVGFSALESDVYWALLQEPGSSGYRLAQMVGKQAANIYKALDSLRTKGAVLADESTRPTTYVALPIREYMDAKRRDLESLQTQIEHELEDVAASPAHGGIFELPSIAQVYERCRELLRNAKTVVLLNADARPLEELRSELNAAADRGVRVLIKTRAPIPGQPAAPEAARGQELAIAVDFKEYVQAFLKSDGSEVEEAIWVRHPHLANQVCSLFQSDFTLTRVRAMVQAGKEVREIGREMHRLTRMVEVQAPPEMLPHEWVLTDAREGIQKRRRALKKSEESQPAPEPQKVGKVTLRQIELIMVASSRTVIVESADILDPCQTQPEGTNLPAIDPNTLIDPLL
jgi:HTH-type transcriptional regulator, sugar sensing transcriptional regulator